MFECTNKAEELAVEPSIPMLSLSDFRGGNQLPTRDIADKDFQLKKQIAVLPLLLQTWAQCEASDLAIRLGTSQLQCNRLRLMCYSEYAMQVLAAGQRELLLPEHSMTLVGLQRVCDWLVEPANQPLERCNILQMLAAATFLQIDKLIKEIWYCLDLQSEFSEDQAFVIFTEVLSSGSNIAFAALDRIMLLRIQCFFLTLVASVDFVRLPIQQVCQLLSSDNLAVNCEKETFFAALRWLMYDWPARGKYLVDIMKTVRLMLLSREFLYQLTAPTDESALNLIIEQAEFQKLISYAFTAKNLMEFNDGSESFQKLYKIFDVSEALPRFFICHDLCAYHKQTDDEFYADFSYQQFLSYLCVLQNAGVNAWKSLKNNNKLGF